MHGLYLELSFQYLYSSQKYIKPEFNLCPTGLSDYS